MRLRHLTPAQLAATVARTTLAWLLALALTMVMGVAPALAQAIPIPPSKPPGGGLPDGSPTLPKVNLPRKGRPAATQAKPPRGKPHGHAASLQPFGANLFLGNFLGAREDGLNPGYVILPGDRVAVYAWGSVEISHTFIVDGQGNIFLPGIGPIHLAGVRNARLTQVVRKGMQRVYARGFDVYTNLITAKPVAVFVTGGVAQPGRYAGIPSDSPLFFLDQAGGIDAQLGSYRQISVLRAGKSLAEIDLYDFVLQGKLPEVQFEDGDTILVKRRGPVVELRGDVAQPALLEFPADPIKGADALAIIPGAARATQVTITGVRNSIPFGHTLSVPAFSSFPIQDGDAITLRADGQSETILVKLEGETKGPTTLAIQRGARLIDVLNYVPVDPSLANVNAVHIRRASVARAQKKSIDNALFRLERSALLALSQSNGESNIRAKEAELTLNFVERARLIQPLGRVVTSRRGEKYNLLLQNNDVIVVPPRTNVVRVSGEVMMAQAVMYRPGAEAEDYIEDAGGYTDRGDNDKVVIIHPNAEVTIGGPGVDVGPGDEVLVPPDVDIKWLQNVADVTSIIYQIAVSTAVMISLGTLASQ